jgi:hypothetical protein
MNNLPTDSYRRTQEYQELIEESKAIVVEHAFNIRMTVILGKGQLGERIVEDPLFKKHSKGNQKFLRDVADDIGISYSTLCRAVQFYEQYKITEPDSPGWQKINEGKDISWTKIKKEYLPSGERDSDDKGEDIVSTKKIALHRFSKVNNGLRVIFRNGDREYVWLAKWGDLEDMSNAI